MVAIVTSNGLGLAQSSAFVLGAQGQIGQASLGRAGENVFVNAATGGLTVGKVDEMVFGTGPDMGLGHAIDEFGDRHVGTRKSVSGYGSTSSPMYRTDWDGSFIEYLWDASRSAYVADDGEGSYDILYQQSSQWIWEDGSSNAKEVYEYDPISTVTNPGRWRILSQTDTDGNEVTYTYASGTYGKLTRITTESGEYTDLIYSGDNLIRLETYRFIGNTNGGSLQKMTRVYYDYDGSNRLSKVTVDLSPGDNTLSSDKYETTYGYDGSSRVNSVTQTDGSSLAITYDGSGRVYELKETVTVVSGTPVLRTTTMTYSLSGSTMTTTVTDPDGNATVMVSNANGWLTSVTYPAPVAGGTSEVTTFTYDSSTGDVLTIASGSTNRLDFHYDSHGNRVAERDLLGNTILRTFSGTDKLLTESRYATRDADASTSTWHNMTNAWGSSNAPGDALTTRYAYDNEDHLRYVVTAEGAVTEYVYNAAGQQIEAIEYLDHRYSLGSLAADASISESTLNTWRDGLSGLADIRRTDTTYDFRGNVESVTTYEKIESDGDGDLTGVVGEIRYVYDQAGRLLTRIAPDDTQESYSYDGMGRLTFSSNFVDGETTIAYNDASRTKTITLANNATQVSTYNLAGELISVLESSTGFSATTTYQYDDLGRLRIIKDDTDVKTHFVYDRMGRKVADIKDDGTIVEYRYNPQNDQIAAIIQYATKLDSTRMAKLVDGTGKPIDVDLWGTAGNRIFPVADNAADRWEWRFYDNAQRLSAVIAADGAVTAYAYDGASRLTTTTAYSTSVTMSASTWKPTSTTGVPAVLSTTAPSFTTDSTNDRVVRNFYDKRGYLTGTLDAEGYLTQIVNNGSGQTIKTIRYANKPTSGSTLAALVSNTTLDAAKDVYNYFVYDGRGQLAAEINGEGDVVRYRYDAMGYLAEEIRGQKLGSVLFEGFKSDQPALADLPAGDPETEVLEVRTFARNLYGQLLSETRLVRDELGELVEETDLYTYADFTADGLQRIERIQYVAGTASERAVIYHYDSRGRIDAKVEGENAHVWLTGHNSETELGGTGGGDTVSGTSSADYLYGYEGDDALSGLGGADELYGQGGDDILDGGPGSDIMYGGLGNDAYYVDDVNDEVYETKGEGTDTVYSSISYKLASTASIEAFATTNSAGTGAINLAGNGNSQTITGNDGANALFGNGGNDTLQGGGGNDWLIGGAGSDTLTGGAGADSFVFDPADGNDADTITDFAHGVDRIDIRTFTSLPVVSQNGSHAVITIGSWSVTVQNFIAANLAMACFVLPTVSTSYGGNNINATSGADTISGTSGADTINGGGGADVLSGLGGNDKLSGGTAGDTLHGGDDNDWLIGDANLDTLNGDAGNDLLEGGGNDDTLNGGDGDDVLKGEDGNDILSGGAGRDIIQPGGHTSSAGGSEASISGGADGDVFVIRNSDYPSGTTTKTITDFTVGSDLLDTIGMGTATITQSGSDTLITYSSNKIIKLVGVTASTVTSACFVTTAPATAPSQPSGPPGSGMDRSGFYYEGYGTTFQYDDADRLISMTTPTQDNEYVRTVYYYDKLGRLRYEVDALGNVKEFVYNTFGQVTQAISHTRAIEVDDLPTLTGGLIDSTITGLMNDGDGDTVWAHQHDATVTTTYNLTGTVNSVVDARGSTTAYSYNSYREWLTATTTLTGSNSVENRQSYDRRGQVSKLTEDYGGAGRETEYRYDALGRLIKVIDPRDNEFDTGYDRAGRVKSSKDAYGAETTFSYDGRGKLVTKTDPFDNDTTYTYDEFSRELTVTTPEGVTVRTLNNAHGQTLWIYDGENRTTEFRYNHNGQLLRSIDGLGYKVTNSYDEGGRLVWSGDTRGVETLFSYDSLNRLLVKTFDYGGLNLETVYEYDILVDYADTPDEYGIVTRVTHPDGTVTETTFSPAGDKVVDVVDVGGLNLKTTYAHDLVGRTTRVEQAPGTSAERVTEYEYDDLGRTKSITIAPGDLDITTEFEYDLNDNVIARTDANGNVERFIYDDNNRQIYAVDGVGTVTRTEYDALGRVVAVTTYSDALTAGELSALPGVTTPLVATDLTSRFTANTSADRTTRMVYDDDGHLRFTIDPEKGPVEFVYDDAGNVIRTVAYNDHITPSSYALDDVITAVSGITDKRTTRAVFDGANRQVYAIDAEGAVTAFGYDVVGNVIKQVRYDNEYTTSGDRTQAQMDDWADDTAQLTDTANRISRAMFDAARRTVYAIDAEGFVTHYTYDDAGRVLTQTRYADAESVSDVTTLTDLATAIGAPTTQATITYDYDTAGRLIDIENALGIHERRTLDALGQVTMVTRAYGTGDAATTEYEYDAAGRVIEEKVQLATSTYAVTTKEYDAFGNVVKITDDNLAVGYFYYDKANRLTLQVDPEKCVTKTEYTFGGEVKKVTRFHEATTATLSVGAPPSDPSGAKSETQFEYDQAGRLTGVIDAEGKREDYELDAFGDRIKVYSKLHTTLNPVFTTNVFDKLGRLVKETLPVTTANNSGTQVAVINTFEYDAFGNLTKSVEGNDDEVAGDILEKRTTLYAYDKLNRLTTKTADTVTVTDQTTLGTSSKALVEKLTYDARNNVVRIERGEGSNWTETFYYYDKADRKIAEVVETDPVSTQAKGILKTWAYDDRNNAETATVYGTAINLPTSVSVTPPTGSGDTRVVVSIYDLNNRLIETKVTGLTFGAWDTVGNDYETTDGDLRTLFTYDGMGNLLRQKVEADGAAVSDSFVYYDKLGRKVAQVDAEKYLTTYTLDAEGNVTQENRYANKVTTTPAVNVAVSTYVGEVSSGGARTTDFTYDKMGRRTSEARAGVSYYTVGGTGALSTATTAASTITYTYNALGGVLTKTEASGESVTYTFDGLNRETSAITSGFDDFDGGSQAQRRTITAYNALGGVSKVTVDDNDSETTRDRVTTYTYGTGGRLESMTDAVGFSHTYGYDLFGRQVMDKYTRYKSDGTTAVTEAVNTRYDVLGRVVAQAMGTYASGTWSFNNDVQTTAYNGYGEVSARGVGTLQQEAFHYDKAGRMWKSTAGDGVTRLFMHDGLGNVSLSLATSGGTSDLLAGYTSIENALATLAASNPIGSTAITNVAISIADYDARGQVIETIERFRGGIYNYGTEAIGSADIVRSKTYNAYGEVASETDANGNTTDYAYNTMGRLTQKTSPEITWRVDGNTPTTSRPVETYRYDRAGRLVAVVDANGNTTTRRLLAHTGLGGSDPIVLGQYLDTGSSTVLIGQAQAVDAFGDVRRLIDGEGRIEERTYDKMSRLIAIKRPRDATSFSEQFYAYDGISRRIQEWNSHLTSSVKATTDYDAFGRVIKTVALGGDATDYSYTWSNSGATGGMATYGSLTKVTTIDARDSSNNRRTSTEVTDYFGRVIDRVDYGGHDYAFTFNKAGQLVTQTNNVGQTISHSYYNTGLRAGATAVAYDGVYQYLNTTVDAEYAYDLNGNRVFEHQEVSYWREERDTESPPESPVYVWVEQEDRVLQDSVVHYDALNRMVSLDDAASNEVASAPVSIDYEYDRVGNLVHMDAEYDPIGDGDPGSQEYWYKYDALNRLMTTKGTLDTDDVTIVRGVEGTDITYDLAGRRKQAFTTVGFTTHQEDYLYSHDGYLTTVKMKDGSGDLMVRAENEYDLMGRLEKATEYKNDGSTSAPGTKLYEREIDYDAKSQIIEDRTYIRDGDNSRIVTTNYYYKATTDAYATFEGAYQGHLYAAVSETTDDDGVGSLDGFDPTRVIYNYAWWDSAKDGGNVYWPDTGESYSQSSLYEFDSHGNLARAQVFEGFHISDARDIRYLYNADHQGVKRWTYTPLGAPGGPAPGPIENHIYFNGLRIGDIGNTGGPETYVETIDGRNQGSSDWDDKGYANFDLNYQAVHPSAQASTHGSYTVQGGETLQVVAANLWGDASLWYLLAQANGLNGTEYLTAGRTLMVPANATALNNVHNNADTFKPYDPNVVVGDNFPGAMRQLGIEHPRCGPEVVLIALVAAVVAVLVAQYALPKLALAFAEAGFGTGAIGGLSTAEIITTAGGVVVEGGSAAGLAAGAVSGGLAGAASSIAGQGVAMALGVQDKFDWKQVGLSALSGAVNGLFGAGMPDELFGSAMVSDAVRGVASEAITQSLAVATGLQDHFSWIDVAVSGITAVAGGAFDRSVNANLDAWEATQPLEVRSSASFDFKLDLARALGSAGAGLAAGIVGTAAKSLLEGSSFGDNLQSALPSLIGSTIGNAIAQGLSATGVPAQIEERLPDVLADLEGTGAAGSGSSPFATTVQSDGSVTVEMGADGRPVVIAGAMAPVYLGEGPTINPFRERSTWNIALTSGYDADGKPITGDNLVLGQNMIYLHIYSEATSGSIIRTQIYSDPANNSIIRLFTAYGSQGQPLGPTYQMVDFGQTVSRIPALGLMFVRSTLSKAPVPEGTPVASAAPSDLEMWRRRIVRNVGEAVTQSNQRFRERWDPTGDFYGDRPRHPPFVTPQQVVTEFANDGLALVTDPVGAAIDGAVYPLFPDEYDPVTRQTIEETNREHPLWIDPDHIHTGAERRALVTAGAMAYLTGKLTPGARVVGSEIALGRYSGKFLTAAEFEALAPAGTINPRLIRFSQDGRSLSFKDGGSVDDLVNGLLDGTVSPGDIPPIRIVVKDGQVYTLDNRRLYAFQQADVDVPYVRLDAIPPGEMFKFTTVNEGTSIGVNQDRRR